MDDVGLNVNNVVQKDIINITNNKFNNNKFNKNNNKFNNNKFNNNKFNNNKFNKDGEDNKDDEDNYKIHKFFCKNCHTYGHISNKCYKPICSYGIICFKKYKGQFYYLTIRRKHTIGYTEFLRGKYNFKDVKFLTQLFSEMTKDEIENIKNNDFNVLWKELWMIQEDKILNHKNEYKKSESKFNNIKRGDFIIYKGKKILFSIDYIINNVKTKFFDNTEIGFPKGRRNLNESEFLCAFREFSEETNIPKKQCQVINYNKVFIEEYNGSNEKRYKHIYYLSKHLEEIDDFNKDVKIDPNNIQQQIEIGEIKWYNYNELSKLIRPYHQDKKKVLMVVEKYLKKHKY
jgi:8-oxo-dGTP pyrophosphatase MutT (NUDIX family)